MYFIWVSMYLARKCQLGALYFTSPNGDRTAILRGHPSHAKVQPPAGQREYLHFSVILRPWVLVRPRESNPRPPALQTSALPTELILPRFSNRTGTSFDDGKVRENDQTWLPVPNLSLCHWSSRLIDLRAPSSTDVHALLLNQPNSLVGRCRC